MGGAAGWFCSVLLFSAMAEFDSEFDVNSAAAERIGIAVVLVVAVKGTNL